MTLRTGAQFLEGLRDGREVWLAGERVDVTSHPLLAPCAQAIAEVYDLQHDPAYRDQLTMTSPSSGDPVSLAWLEPRSTEDLQRRRAMIELLARRSGGTMGRLPEYMATILMGLYNARDVLAEENPAYATRITSYFELCREKDLCLTHGFTDPPRDRSRPAKEFEQLRVVHRDDSGIVIRGAKAVATLAPYADEYLGLTAHRPELRPEEVLYFAVPVATPGLRVICRESFTQRAPGDHRLSAFYDEMDAWIMFEDVFIPHERVFFLDRPDMNLRIFSAIPSAWAFYHMMIRQAVKAEVMAGICGAIIDYTGTASQPQAQSALADAIGYVETLRAFLYAAEHQPIFSSFGLAIPNPLQTIQGRIHFMERHTAMIQLVRDVCGAAILMAPGDADMNHPEIGAAVRQYLGAEDPRAPDRFRMMKLAWELAGDSFGSRQLLFELFNGGTLAVNRGRLVNTYDIKPMVSLAKQLAGISEADRPSPANPQTSG